MSRSTQVGAEFVEGGVKVSITVPLPERKPAEAGEPLPDGEAATPAGPRATHTRGFESANWFGRTYHFTKKQRAAVALLWAAWEESVENDDPARAAVHQAVLLEDADSTQQRLRDVFEQGRHPAWGTMIVLAVTHGTGKSGCYMLRAPDGAEG